MKVLACFLPASCLLLACFLPASRPDVLNCYLRHSINTGNTTHAGGAALTKPSAQSLRSSTSVKGPGRSCSINTGGAAGLRDNLNEAAPAEGLADAGGAAPTTSFLPDDAPTEGLKSSHRHIAAATSLVNLNLRNEYITPAAAGNVLTAIEESKEMEIAEAIVLKS